MRTEVGITRHVWHGGYMERLRIMYNRKLKKMCEIDYYGPWFLGTPGKLQLALAHNYGGHPKDYVVLSFTQEQYQNRRRPLITEDWQPLMNWKDGRLIPSDEVYTGEWLAPVDSKKELETLVHSDKLSISEIMLLVQHAKKFPLKVTIGRGTVTLRNKDQATMFSMGICMTFEASVTKKE
jgi:hypothetical protein